MANNSYAKGIVLTLANDTVGTGPRGRFRLHVRPLGTRLRLASARQASALQDEVYRKKDGLTGLDRGRRLFQDLEMTGIRAGQTDG